jgi:hypothetical protein
MDTSDDESSSSVLPFRGIFITRYRLTDSFCAPPLYSTPILVPFYTFSFLRIDVSALVYRFISEIQSRRKQYPEPLMRIPIY